MMEIRASGILYRIDTSPQPRKNKTMALTNRRHVARRSSAQPSGRHSNAAGSRRRPQHQRSRCRPSRDDRTILTEVAPAPGPGTGGRGRPPKEQRASFFDGLFDYPKQEWDDGRMVLSLYRLEPYTDRTAGGPKPVWVMKYAGPVDQERICWIMASGRYSLVSESSGSRAPPKPFWSRPTSLKFSIRSFLQKSRPASGLRPANKKWAWAHPSRQRQDGPLGVSDVPNWSGKRSELSAQSYRHVGLKPVMPRSARDRAVARKG